MVKSEVSPFLLTISDSRHIFHLPKLLGSECDANVDRYGDSYARDVFDENEMRDILTSNPMPTSVKMKANGGSSSKISQTPPFETLLPSLPSSLTALRSQPSFLFSTLNVYVSCPGTSNKEASYPTLRVLRFGNATFSSSLEASQEVTHIVVLQSQNGGVDDQEVSQRVRDTRQRVSEWKSMPRIVGETWVEHCWAERTLLDEERFGGF